MEFVFITDWFYDIQAQAQRLFRLIMKSDPVKQICLISQSASTCVADNQPGIIQEQIDPALRQIMPDCITKQVRQQYFRQIWIHKQKAVRYRYFNRKLFGFKQFVEVIQIHSQ